MFSEGAAKVWFILFIICVALAAVAGIGYINQQTELQLKENSYNTINAQYEASVDKYNDLLESVEDYQKEYDALLEQQKLLYQTELQKLTNDYNTLVQQYNQCMQK